MSELSSPLKAAGFCTISGRAIVWIGLQLYQTFLFELSALYRWRISLGKPAQGLRGRHLRVGLTRLLKPVYT